MCLQRTILLFLIGSLPASSFADTITFAGETHEDVIVKESSSLYYVLFPGDGRSEVVDKSEVNAADVVIDEDIEARRALQAKWRASRGGIATFRGRCVGVMQGDLILVKHRDSFEKVRLYAIHCPEFDQEFGLEAREQTISLLFGNMVAVQVKKTKDDYGCTIGMVHLMEDSTNINLALVAGGFAWWDSRHATGARAFEEAQREARAKGVGLWSHPNPIDPWDYEKGVRSSAEAWKRGQTPRDPASVSRSADTTSQRASSDVTYEILEATRVAHSKRTLVVRLNKAASEKALRSIAIELRNQEPQHYDQTFINYYLPGMTVGTGSWATTHFCPNLEVRILGLTPEKEQRELRQPEDPSRDVVGTWIDDFLGTKMTIYRQQHQFFLEEKFKDGTALRQEVVETRSPLGRRFNETEEPAEGEYFIINQRGNLELRDNEGLIATARRVM